MRSTVSNHTHFASLFEKSFLAIWTPPAFPANHRLFRPADDRRAPPPKPPRGSELLRPARPCPRLLSAAARFYGRIEASSRNAAGSTRSRRGRRDETPPSQGRQGERRVPVCDWPRRAWQGAAPPPAYRLPRGRATRAARAGGRPARQPVPICECVGRARGVERPAAPAPPATAGGMRSAWARMSATGRVSRRRVCRRWGRRSGSR